MAYTKIRDIPDEQLIVIDDLAKQKHLSREAYLRTVVEQLFEQKILTEVEEHFNEIVAKVTRKLEETDRLFMQIMEKLYGDT
ncbi:hypothetical protein [Lactococcus allomyrinae]|uniref:hypothetical protein n=1 Tax=Lactococcus allomyrinae TaxID=2419773 RepID=UPI0013C4F02C|nr:hypothetical protein [Lactococcus allomyrinae]